jgi:hypothetical protein
MASVPDPPSSFPGADSGPGRRAVLAPLTRLGRLLPTALQDLRTIAESVRLLPRAVEELAAIRGHVEAMGAEVRAHA